MSKYEDLLEEYHPDWVVGVDEVGYGAWAGPITVCAVATHVSWHPPPGLRDSKKMSAKNRTFTSAVLLDDTSAVHHKLLEHSSANIDQLGVNTSRRQLFREAIAGTIGVCESFARSSVRVLVVLDGDMEFAHSFPCTVISVPKADDLVPQVSAASVLAKVHRDRWMEEVAEKEYPVYGFAKHKGYGTLAHRTALLACGPCALHRASYRLPTRQ